MKLFNPLEHPICISRPLMTAPSAWVQHAPFGMCLIDILRPRIFVELGTHYGYSYCAFCQAVKELSTNTRCYAVDTWEGDQHSKFYGAEVLDGLRKHHDPLYGSFSRLIHSTFAEALSHFTDGSIDLLHIDGLHTYEAVKEDFEAWLPKMSERGVVIFHDTNVRERGFGVYRLWEQLKASYPHFEIAHGHGLGLVAVGQQVPPSLQQLLDASTEEAVQIREFFYQLGARLEVAQEAQALREHAVALSDGLREQADAIKTLHARVESMNDREERLQQLWTMRFLQVWSDQGFWGAVQKSIGKFRQKFALPPKFAQRQPTGKSLDEPTRTSEVRTHL